MQIQEFKELVWSFARDNTRVMPWRSRPEAYEVLVSEIMLQQTQVGRVIPKFKSFISCFPDIKILAQAPLSEVLVAWSGLGYNRRAKFLHAAAIKIMTEFDGNIPVTKNELVMLPGVGENTAGAILAYAFNQPAVFVETNIRSVYFQHFFSSQAQVSDKELRAKVELTLDREHPRQWYWALMDYGAYLKKNGAAGLSRSSHYKKQTPLKGSTREMRGRIIKSLAEQPLSEHELQKEVSADERFEPAIQALVSEQLIVMHGSTYALA